MDCCVRTLAQAHTCARTYTHTHTHAHTSAYKNTRLPCTDDICTSVIC